MYREIPKDTIKLFSYENSYVGCCGICDEGHFDICIDQMLNGKRVTSVIWSEHYDCKSYEKAIDKYREACNHYQIQLFEDSHDGERIL